MFDFFWAAFPWVAIGIALAVLAANYSKKKKNRQEQPDVPAEEDSKKEAGNYMSEGMCIGMCLGSAFGSMRGFNIGIGICLGMLFGLVIGMNIKK